jgi:hypothetical protein
MADVQPCTWCGGPIDPAFELAEFGDCVACVRLFNDTYIAGFALDEDVHYERGADGEVAYWLGDPALTGAALWRTLHTQARADGTLDAMTRAEMVLWTQRCLDLLHGPLPAPFGVEVVA